MKVRSSSLILPFLVSATLLLFGSKGFMQLVLEVQPNKQTYLLGEPVALKFNVINGSNDVVVLPDRPSVWRGGLGVFIPYQDGGFKGYLGPRWGLEDTRGDNPLPLASGQSYETSASILYNHRFETGHLSEVYAKETRQKHIDTEIAFPKPGVYRIKAILALDSKNEIESKPVTIEVAEPYTLDDVEVWNVLKSDPEYAYFIQTGGFRASSGADPKSKQMVENLERLLSLYPTSTYSQAIRDALSKQRAAIQNLKKAGLLKD
jgi:hypothetical protein